LRPEGRAPLSRLTAIRKGWTAPENGRSIASEDRKQKSYWRIKPQVTNLDCFTAALLAFDGGWERLRSRRAFDEAGVLCLLISDARLPSRAALAMTLLPRQCEAVSRGNPVGLYVGFGVPGDRNQETKKLWLYSPPCKIKDEEAVFLGRTALLLTDAGLVIVRGGTIKQVVVWIPSREGEKISWRCKGGPARAIPKKRCDGSVLGVSD
jgi:hypothetical protein